MIERPQASRRLWFQARLAKNTIILLLGNAGTTILSLMLSILIGRNLGESGLGTYTTALAWVTPVALLAEFGLATLLTREIASDPQATHSLVNTAIRIRFWMGSGLSIGLVLVAPFLSQERLIVLGIQLSAMLVWIQPLFSTYTSVFRARQAMLPITLLNLGMLLTQVVLTWLLLLQAQRVEGVFMINSATSALQLFATWLIYRWRFRAGKACVTQAMPLMQQALPFAIAAVLAALHMRLNILWLEQVWNSAETGYYAAASRIPEVVRVASIAFFDAAFPLLVSLSGNANLLRQYLRRMLVGLGITGLAFAAAATLAGPFVILFLYGEVFINAIQPMIILSWATIPLLLRSTLTFYGYVQRDETFVNSTVFVSLVARMLFCALLIPPYGASGAALAHLATETFGMLLLAGRHLPINWLRISTRP